MMMNDNREQMKDELFLAPSSGRSRVESHLHSTDWSASEQVDSTASCNWQLVQRSSTRHSRVLKRVRGGRTGAVKDLALHCLHKESVGLCLSNAHRFCLYPTHTELHIAPDTSRACRTHTSCVHTRLSLWSSAAIQRCSAILWCKVINYSLRISALVQSWAR